MSKPSWKDAPLGANYLAQDENGTYTWYETEPYLGFMSYLGEWLTEDNYEYAGFDPNSSDWINSLEELPVKLSIQNCGPAEVKDLRGKVSIDDAYDNEPTTTVFQGMPILGHNYKNPNPFDYIHIDPVYVSHHQEFDDVENDNQNAVNHPSHYSSGNIECIDAIREALTEEELRGYFKGNCMKYLWRERHKNGDEDLKKAKVYLDWLIEEGEKNA